MHNRDINIINGSVFDGINDVLHQANVVIRDGIIVDFTPEVPDDTDVVIDAAGRTVMPGLIDAHFHAYATDLDGAATSASPLSYVALKASLRLTAALRRGFTTVRDVAGGDPGLADAISEGIFPSPDYLYTGPALSQTGGHGDFRDGRLDVCYGHAHSCEVVDGVDDLRRAVRERFRRGAHAIKIMASGGVISPSDPLKIPQYSPEEIRAVTTEARRRGSYVCAHAYTAEAVKHAILNGVRSIEHGNLIDAETARLMRDHEAFLVPTLAAYDAMDRRGGEAGLSAVGQDKNQEVLAAGKTAVRLARSAGVDIGFGSDLMGDLADEQLEGLRLQADADSLFGVLRSATSVNAALLNLSDRGRLAAGQRADVLVLDADLSLDPSALWDRRRPRQVIQQGTLI